MPNWSQVSGVIERVVMAGVMFGVGKGWIASDDAVNMRYDCGHFCCCLCLLG